MTLNKIAEMNRDLPNGGGSEPAVSWLLCAHILNDQLRHALQSCLDQTFLDFELLLVANGSAAEDIASAVREWAGHDPRVSVFTTEVRHLIFSLSLGLHHARAPLVARMDADDLSTSDRLERQVTFMKEHPACVVLGSAYEVIDDEGRIQKTVYPPTINGQIRRALLWRNPLCHPSVMFRRKAVLDVGGYLGGLHAEDYDLWVRLSVAPENQFANLDVVCLGYRSVSVGVARRSSFAYATMAAAQLRNFIIGQGLVWAVAALFTTVKAFFRSKSVQRIS